MATELENKKQEFYAKMRRAIREYIEEKHSKCDKECTCKFTVPDFADWLNEPYGY
jgi:hypothetical protein